MASLANKIRKYVNAEVDFNKDVIIRDDMISNISNPYIKEWNLDIAQPTDAQLASYETVANTAEANAQVDAARRQAYGSWGDQLDEIYHDIEAWKTRIQGIKDNNPKS